MATELNRVDTAQMEQAAAQMRQEIRSAEPKFVSVADALGAPAYDEKLEVIEHEIQQMYRRMAALLLDQRNVMDSILPRISGGLTQYAKRQVELERRIVELEQRLNAKETATDTKTETGA